MGDPGFEAGFAFGGVRGSLDEFIGQAVAGFDEIDRLVDAGLAGVDKDDREIEGEGFADGFERAACFAGVVRVGSGNEDVALAEKKGGLAAIGAGAAVLGEGGGVGGEGGAGVGLS